MTPQETLGSLIDKAIVWETMARDLYASLSAAFAAQPEAAALWHQMSLDEAHHADVCETVRATLTASRLSEPIGPDHHRQIHAVDALWAAVASRTIRTLDDAYETAHELEASEINVVFRLVTLGVFDDPLRERVLAAQLDEHVHRLDTFGRTCGRTCRRLILLGADEG